MQADGPVIGNLLKFLEDGTRPTLDIISKELPELKCYWAQWYRFKFRDEIIYRKFKTFKGDSYY